MFATLILKIFTYFSNFCKLFDGQYYQDCKKIVLRQEFKSKTWPKDKPLIRGGSVIISPMGEIIAGHLYNEEGLISAEIDLNDIVKARYDMDPAGHYSRPDIFKLIVGEKISILFCSCKIVDLRIYDI